MNSIIRNILAVAGGVVVGMLVNGGLITMSPHLIPPPEGVDVNNPESLKANIHLFQAKHFLFPFIAHVLGTLTGAFVSAFIAESNKMRFAYGIGVFFLLGGIAASFMIPAPGWFIAVDLLLAYLPMAWVGGKLASRD